MRIVRESLRDVDGDGRADWVECRSSGWDVYFNSGSGFAATADRFDGAGCAAGLGTRLPDGQVIAETIDFNGDGWLDFIHNDTLYLNRGRKSDDANDPAFIAQSVPSFGPPSTSTNRFAGSIYLWSETTARLTDMNGDRLPDYIYRDGGRWYVHLNRAGGGGKTVRWLGIDDFRYIERADKNGRADALVDVNGDGLKDFWFLPSASHCLNHSEKFAVRYNTGSGFGPTVCRDATNVPYHAARGPNAYLRRPEYFRLDCTDLTAGGATTRCGWNLMDIDGDGALEHFYDPGYQDTRSVQLPGTAFPQVIRKVTSVLGGTTEIDYAASTSMADTTVPFVFPVVSKTTTRAGPYWRPSLAHETSYAYVRNQTYRLPGSPIALTGFFKASETDEESGDLVERYFNIGVPSKVGKPSRILFNEAEPGGGYRLVREMTYDYHDDDDGLTSFFTPLKTVHRIGRRRSRVVDRLENPTD